VTRLFLIVAIKNNSAANRQNGIAAVAALRTTTGTPRANQVKGTAKIYRLARLLHSKIPRP
jgi:hypothetical protein